MKIAKHSVAGTHDGGRFAIDQLAEGFAIAGEDRFDDCLVVAETSWLAHGTDVRVGNLAAPLDASLGGPDDWGAAEP